MKAQRHVKKKKRHVRHVKKWGQASHVKNIRVRKVPQKNEGT